MSNAPMLTTMDALNHAAMQSDKWLFLAALFVLAFFAWKVIQWLTEKTNTQQSELKELIRLVGADSKEIAVLLATKAKVIESNSEVIAQNTAMLREVKEVVGRCAIFQQHIEDITERKKSA